MLYPQNGDRIVTIDSVMSLHFMYIWPTNLTNGVVLGNKPVGVSRYKVLRNTFRQIPELDCRFRQIIQLMTCT